jgi:hypothetical protein
MMAVMRRTQPSPQMDIRASKRGTRLNKKKPGKGELDFIRSHAHTRLLEAIARQVEMKQNN